VAITVLPDVWAALQARLKASSAVVALTTTDRIADEIKAAWAFGPKGKAKYAVLIQGPFGGPGETEAPLYRERYDMWCYGPDRRTALVLARTVRAAFIPPSGGAVGFTLAGACIHEIEEEAGPIALKDSVEGWWYVVQPYIVTYNGAISS